MLVLLLLPQSLAAAIIAFVTVCGTFKHTSTAGLWLLLYYYINRIIPNNYRGGGDSSVVRAPDS